MIPGTSTWRAKTYPIEPVKVAWLRLSNRRRAERGPLREARTIERWARRQWRSYEALWHRIGNPRVSLHDAGDLFIRDMVGLLIEQRAVRRDAEWDAAEMPDFDTHSDAISIPILVGEMPKPPAIPSEDDECDCSCCIH